MKSVSIKALIVGVGAVGLAATALFALTKSLNLSVQIVRLDDENSNGLNNPESTNSNNLRRLGLLPFERVGTIGGRRTVCRKRQGSANVYVTVSVRESFSLVTDLRGGVEGSCSERCEDVCNHQPCAPDYSLEGEVCKCFPKLSSVSKCMGPNVRCGYNSTCLCEYGFWTTNISNGCPNVGFTVRDLPYSYDALEPHFDTYTMLLHHTRHHSALVNNLNRALLNTDPDSLQKPIVELQASAITKGTAIRNNAGGHYNHALFWTVLAPPAEAMKTKPSAELELFINAAFGNMTNMKAQFEALAAPGSVFGSGWVWLCLDSTTSSLLLRGTPNQDNPLMQTSDVLTPIAYPILGLDVWEHSYYLKYQNLRPEFVKQFWNLVNWTKVSENFEFVRTTKSAVSVRRT